MPLAMAVVKSAPRNDEEGVPHDDGRGEQSHHHAVIAVSRSPECSEGAARQSRWGGSGSLSVDAAAACSAEIGVFLKRGVAH